MNSLAALPGGESITRGLVDLSAGDETVSALLVSVAATRLRQLGIPVSTPIPEPELRMYRRLSAEHHDAAYARYKALLQQLSSFLHALEREAGARMRATSRPPDPNRA